MADDIRNTPDQEQEEQAEKIDLGASLRREHKVKKPVSRRTALISAVVLVALAAVLAIALPRVLTPAQEEAEPDLTVNLSDHTSDQVVSLTIEGENTFKITKDEEDVYHIDILEDGKVNQSTCSSAFVNAATLQADQLVEENAADLSVYGLEDPVSTLTVAYTDGTLSVELGDVLSVTGQIYCRVQGSNDVYALRTYFANIFGGSIVRYRGLSLPEISNDFTECKSIIIRQSGQEQVRFMPVNDPNLTTTGNWQMTEPKTLWLDSANVSELVESISAVKLYGYEGQFEDLSPYGLDDPWFTVIMSDTNGVRRTISLGDQVEGDNRYYCIIDDSGEVFTISDSYLSFAEDFKISYYLDAFTNIVAISMVDEVVVTDGNKTYTMSIERQEQYDDDGNLKTLANGDPNYLETFFLDGKECQESAFKTAYQALIGVTISNLAEDSLVDETQKPVLTVTYCFNNGQEDMTIEYLPYDINNYCVRRDGAIDLICRKDLVDPILPTMESLKNGELDKEE